MPYAMKPLSCDPARVRGMSERLIISHYENNYGGAVKRLNAIVEQIAGLDYEKAPGFLINGMKREELIASNSMILHELFFDGLGDQSQPGPALKDAISRDFGSFERWRHEFTAMGKALGGGSGWVLLSWSRRDGKLVNQWARITATRWQPDNRSWRSICTSIPTTWISALRQAAMWMCSWMRSAGQMQTGCMPR
jgi:superoxide dismutase, Fe-Mn family